MPLYEYECKACHRRIEKIQKFSDPDLTVCPTCGGDLERTITAAAFSFQGGGWYKDGYASAKASSGSETSAPAAATETASAPAAPAAAPAAAPTAPTTPKP
jgi:putative FmdB family regulatory protein